MGKSKHLWAAFVPWSYLCFVYKYDYCCLPCLSYKVPWTLPLCLHWAMTSCLWGSLSPASASPPLSLFLILNEASYCPWCMYVIVCGLTADLKCMLTRCSSGLSLLFSSNEALGDVRKSKTTCLNLRQLFQCKRFQPFKFYGLMINNCVACMCKLSRQC